MHTITVVQQNVKPLKKGRYKVFRMTELLVIVSHLNRGALRASVLRKHNINESGFLFGVCFFSLSSEYCAHLNI